MKKKKKKKKSIKFPSVWFPYLLNQFAVIIIIQEIIISWTIIIIIIIMIIMIIIIITYLWTFHDVAFLVHCFQVELKFRKLVFVGRGNLEDPEKSPQRTRTNNKLNPHVTPKLGTARKIEYLCSCQKTKELKKKRAMRPNGKCITFFFFFSFWMNKLG